MRKHLFKITLIIFGNLFAFLSVGHILDSLLNNSIPFKLIFIGISIIPLMIGMFLYISKVQKDFLQNTNKESK